MIQGVNTYDLPDDTIDLLEHQIRTNAGQQSNQTDITISRISVSTYSTIPNKLAQSRPIQVWVNRQSGASYPTGDNPDRHPQITVWPTPDQGTVGNPTYTFVYWRMRRIQDTGTGMRTQDIPFRMVECMVAGLAYKLSMKLPNVDTNRVAALKMEYEQQWQLAADEDRDKASDRYVPRPMVYR